MSVELALRFDAEVGEGPIWDSHRRELIFVDVTRGSIHRFNPSNSQVDSISIGIHIGAVGLLDQSRYIAAVRDGFATVDLADGKIKYLARVLESDEIRFNDGKCDPFGNFVAGTMRYQPARESAALYSIDSSKRVKTLISGIGLSNGLCWDSSGKKFFYIDTLSRQVALFDYDQEFGVVGNRRVVYEFAEDAGSPDGMTIDLEENLWVALWGGGKVVCLSPDGRLIRELALPVSQPTSLAFGGDKYESLFITSARYMLDEKKLESEPLAGSIFVADVATRGRAEPTFDFSR